MRFLILLPLLVAFTGCEEEPSEFQYSDFDPGPYDVLISLASPTDRSSFVTDTLEHLDLFVDDSLFTPKERTGPFEFFEIADVDVSVGGNVVLLDRGSHILSIHFFDGRAPIWTGGPGESPQEIIAPQFVSILQNERIVAVYERARGVKIYELTQDSLSFQTTIPISADVYDMTACNNEIVVAAYAPLSGGKVQNLIRVYGENGQFRRSFYPSPTLSSNPVVSMVANDLNILCDLDSQRLAVVRETSPVIRIFDFQTGEQLRTFHFDQRRYRSVRPLQMDDGISVEFEELSTYDQSLDLLNVSPNLFQFRIRRTIPSQSSSRLRSSTETFVVDWNDGRAERWEPGPLHVQTVSGHGLVSYGYPDERVQFYLHQF